MTIPPVVCGRTEALQRSCGSRIGMETELESRNRFKAEHKRHNWPMDKKKWRTFRLAGSELPFLGSDKGSGVEPHEM